MKYITDTPKGRVYTFYTFDEYRWLRAMGMITEYEPEIKTNKHDTSRTRINNT